MRKVLPILTLILFAAALVVPLSTPQTVESQTATEALTTDMDAKTDDLFNGFGVKGTPTFFINGTIFEGDRTFEAFKAAIDPLLG